MPTGRTASGRRWRLQGRRRRAHGELRAALAALSDAFTTRVRLIRVVDVALAHYARRHGARAGGDRGPDRRTLNPPEPKGAHERRYLHMSQLPDGTWRARFECGPEQGLRIKRALDAFCAPRPGNAIDADGVEHAIPDTRDLGARQMDAVTDIVTIALAKTGITLSTGPDPGPGPNPGPAPTRHPVPPGSARPHRGRYSRTDTAVAAIAATRATARATARRNGQGDGQGNGQACEESDEPLDAPLDETDEPPPAEGETVVLREPGALGAPYPSVEMVLVAGIEHVAAAWAHRPDALPVNLEGDFAGWLRDRFRRHALREAAKNRPKNNRPQKTRPPRERQPEESPKAAEEQEESARIDARRGNDAEKNLQRRPGTRHRAAARTRTATGPNDGTAGPAGVATACPVPVRGPGPGGARRRGRRRPRWNCSPATPPSGPRCSRPTGHCSTSAAPSAWPPRPRRPPCWPGTAAASSPAAPCPATPATPTTSMVDPRRPNRPGQPGSGLRSPPHRGPPGDMGDPDPRRHPLGDPPKLDRPRLAPAPQRRPPSSSRAEGYDPRHEGRSRWSGGRSAVGAPRLPADVAPLGSGQPVAVDVGGAEFRGEDQGRRPGRRARRRRDDPDHLAVHQGPLDPSSPRRRPALLRPVDPAP